MARMSGLLEAIPKGCAWIPRCSCCICYLCFIFTGHKIIADGGFRNEPAIIVPFRRAIANQFFGFGCAVLCVWPVLNALIALNRFNRVNGFSRSQSL